jgi:NAD(P)-dependent dehydrogenase (short-subunit alcohol dehydrogenase family)
MNGGFQEPPSGPGTSWLRGTGGQGDVSKLADLDRLYETINAEGRRIDVVFANAGHGEFAALGSITEDHFDRLFNINVKGALFTVQKALPGSVKPNVSKLNISNIYPIAGPKIAGFVPVRPFRSR